MKTSILPTMLLLASCKASLITFNPSISGKSPIPKREKEKEVQKEVTDESVNDWLKEEFKNIISNPYPL